MFKGHRILYVLTITILFLTAGFTACQGSNFDESELSLERHPIVNSATRVPLPSLTYTATSTSAILPTQTATSTPNTLLPTQTPVLAESLIATNTATPTAMSTSSPLAPTPCPPLIFIIDAIPVYIGPGFEYELLKELPPNDSGLDLRGRNPENTWFQIASVEAPEGFAWIPANPKYSHYEFCNTASLPIAQGPPTPTPTPSPTPLPAPTGTPTPFYFFDAFILTENEESCVLLNWDIRHVREIYMAGVENADVSIIPKPDNDDWIMLTGDYNQIEDCPDNIVGKKYTMHIIHTDGSECSISRIYSDGDFEEQNLCKRSQ